MIDEYICSLMNKLVDYELMPLRMIFTSYRPSTVKRKEKNLIKLCPKFRNSFFDKLTLTV